MKIYLVEDCGNSPGLIYACFAVEEEAKAFADEVEAADATAMCEVLERTLFYDQPPRPGYCE